MTSGVKMTMRVLFGFLLITFFAVSGLAQNKDIILRVDAGRGGCARPQIRLEFPSRIASDQKVKFKISYKSSGGQPPDVGEGNLQKDKWKYSFIQLGPKGDFDGSIIVELTFADNSTAISNEVYIKQEGKWRDTCSDLMTGNQMAADPEPPPPVIKKGRIVGTLKAEYQLASKQSGRPCPANAAISGTIAMNEDGRETVYYRLVRWNAKSQTPLQPYYKVDLEKSTAPKGGGGASTARVGTQVNVLPSSVSITPSTWVVGETEPQFSEGVVQLWRVTPGPNGTFTYDGFLSAVNLSCGSSRGGSRGEPSKGGNSVIKPNRKPR